MSRVWKGSWQSVGDGKYEPGERSGAWIKMRVNQAQDFVIGGYTVGGATFDALILGCYDGPAVWPPLVVPQLAWRCSHRYNLRTGTTTLGI